MGTSKPALNCRPGHFDPVRPDSVPSTPAIEKANLDRGRSFAAACGKKYAKLLPYIDTVSAVQDMDAIRRALGAKQINYFGYSYGTYLGAVYAKLFPERVRRMVLDSIVDPTGVWYDDNLAQDYAFNDRHRAFMAWIAKYDATYKLGTDPAKIEAKWYAMRDGPREEARGREGGRLRAGGHLHPRRLLQRLLAIPRRGVRGVRERARTPTRWSRRTRTSAPSTPPATTATASTPRCSAVTPSWPRDWKQWREDNWEVYEKAPFMAWSNAWYNAPCAFWPTDSLDPVNVSNGKLPPVLLFQATDDAATPYEGGVTVHRLLPAPAWWSSRAAATTASH